MIFSVEKISAIVLAGGASRRMGAAKAWLELDGVPLIARVLARVRELADDVLISANDAAPFNTLNARVVPDAFPNAGPLAGICAGLQAAAHDVAIVVACDMPFVNTALLAYMGSFAPEYDVVLPQTSVPPPTAFPHAAHTVRAKDLALHPLHAIYTKRCVVPIREALQRGDRRMIAFHDAVRVRVLTPQEVARFDPLEYSMRNVNTPEKWMEVQELYAKLKTGAAK
jgi:molybdopterin-guanine dinucleotide biosynthesis protein A